MLVTALLPHRHLVHRSTRVAAACRRGVPCGTLPTVHHLDRPTGCSVTAGTSASGLAGHARHLRVAHPRTSNSVAVDATPWGTDEARSSDRMPTRGTRRVQHASTHVHEGHSPSTSRTRDSLRTLNLGILAHVDAGKTSLTERLLYAAGVIDEIGSVDDGSTQTDSLALERQRGITIKSAVVSFVARRRHGQPDRHTRPPGLHRRGGAGARRARRRGARRLRGRRRAGADPRADADAAAAAHPDARASSTRSTGRGAQYDGRAPTASPTRCSRRSSPMGSVADLGTRDARVTPFGAGRRRPCDRPARAAGRARRALLAAYVDDEASIPYARLREALAAQTAAARGAAGVLRLGDHRRRARRAVRRHHRAAAGSRTATPTARSPARCSRSSAGRPGRRSPTCGSSPGRCARGTWWPSGRGPRRRSPRSASSSAAPPCRAPSFAAGQIAKVWGLGGSRVGDAVGAGRGRRPSTRFAPPTLETVVEPRRGGRPRRAAHRADPAGRAGPADQRPAGRAARRALGLAVRRGPEGGHRGDPGGRLRRRGRVPRDDDHLHRAAGRQRRRGRAHRTSTPTRSSPPSGCGSIRLRSAPASSSGSRSSSGRCRTRSSPRSRRRSATTLRQGLYGWEVPDCTVTMTHSGYWPRQSHAHGDVRQEHVQHRRATSATSPRWS